MTASVAVKDKPLSWLSQVYGDVQRNITPTRLRNKDNLDSALTVLAEAGRLIVQVNGKSKLVHLNPYLLSEIE